MREVWLVCRLLGYVADRPTSMVEVLGEDGFDQFTALTAVHGDGWGMAWRTDGHDIRTVAAAVSASADPAYDARARTRLGRAGFVHLRWATAGLAVSPENTHPFVDDRTSVGPVAFAHNGHVAPIGRLEGLLDDEARALLRGSTDSERYFRFVVQCLEKEQDVEAGVVRALEVLVGEFPTSSLNALMLTPAQLVAVHINSAAAAPQRALMELFDDADDLPTGHSAEDYFAMDYRRPPGAVHVISSGLDEEDWDPVPPDTAVAIDLETRAITSLRLPG